MESLYILGGRQRRILLGEQNDWNLYESALILRLDTTSGETSVCVDYKRPPEARASEDVCELFKTGTLIDNTLYACTSTEVLIFQLPEFRRIGYISLPCFNDLHHVTPCSDGNLLVANTGLDMVVKVSPEGRVLNTWDVLGDAPWSKFSPDVDYRKLETKPHRSHPNYVFELDGDVWATRFYQRDAISLTGSKKRIAIDVESPHDGLVCGNRIYFTTVDGRIVIVDRERLVVEEMIDLKEMAEGNVLLGWCRGLLPVDERTIWVGFTRVRKTKFVDNVLWVKSILCERTTEMPTHIALYDLVERRCLQEFSLEKAGINTVFSIFPADGPALPQAAAVDQSEVQCT